MKFPASLRSRLCKLCGRHPARFTFRGRVKRDRQHDICPRCYKKLRDRNAALMLPSAANWSRVSFDASPYFFRQLLHQPAVGGKQNQVTKPDHADNPGYLIDGNEVTLL